MELGLRDKDAARRVPSMDRSSLAATSVSWSAMRLGSTSCLVPKWLPLYKGGTCVEPLLMCLCLRRVECITGKGSWVPVEKQRVEYSHRTLPEGHPPFRGGYVESAVRRWSLDMHRMGAKYLVINHKLERTQKMQTEKPTPAKQALAQFIN